MTPPSRAFAPLDFLQLLAIALIWGVNNVAAKIAVDELPPLLVGAMRFGIVLLALFWCIRPLARWQIWSSALMLMCLGPVHFAMLYVSLKMADNLAPMAVALQLWAPASVVFATLILKERVGALRWFGVGLAFAGVAGMAFDPIVFAQVWALVIAGAASCLYGLGAALVRRVGEGMDAWSMQAWIALSTAPLLGLGSVAFEHDWLAQARSASWLAWACVVFGAVMSSIFANVLLVRLVQKYEVSRTTPYLLLTPLISFALGAIVLGDPVTWRIALGAAASLAGVALVALAERRTVSA